MTPRPSKRKDDFRLQNTVRLDADGVAKVLGDLEARIMEALWVVAEPLSARAVHELIADDHPVAVLTVVTVLNKLVDKRLLARRKQDGVYHYAATTTRDEFVSRTSRQMLEGILSFAPDMVATSFVDVLAEQDPEQLAELARLVRRRMRDREQP
jgi:predicted transcriptional regulator